MRRYTPLILSLAVGLSFMASAGANAKGCNGYVNQMDWGCAPWDNNNGPKFPHYPQPAAAKPTVVAAPVLAPAQRPQPVIAPNSGNRVISNDGGSVVSHDGGSIITNDGGTFKK